MQDWDWYKATVRPEWQSALRGAEVAFNINSNGLVRVFQARKGQTLREGSDWVLTMEQAKEALVTVRDAQGQPVKDERGADIRIMLDRKYWG